MNKPNIKTIINLDKNKLKHGYQVTPDYYDSTFIMHRGNYKHGQNIGYTEWHTTSLYPINISAYYIR